MPVGVEQWRAAVGAMARSSAPKPQSPIGPHWKKWLKASDPVVYKGCVVLLVVIAQLASPGLEQYKEKMKEGSESVCQSASRGKTRVLAMRARPSAVLEISLLLTILGNILVLHYHGSCTAEWPTTPVSEEGVSSLVSLLFSNIVRTGVKVVTIIVFVNQMLLMMAGDVERNPGPDPLGLNDLRCVRAAVYCIHRKWYNIGLELNIPFTALDAIEANQRTTDECLTEMLKQWLTHDSPPPSWSGLVEALSSEPVGEKRLARDIQTKYCATQEEEMLLSESAVKYSPTFLPSQYGPKMKDLANHVAAVIPNKWKQVAYQLELTRGEIDSIKSSESSAVERFMAVMELWGKSAKLPYTWETLITALKAPAVEQAKLAIDLQNIFCYRTGNEDEERKLYEEAMANGFIEAALAILIFVGVTGSGKSLFQRLVLGQDVPEFSPSTPLAVRTMSICQVQVHGFKWKIVKPEEMMDIVAKVGAFMHSSKEKNERPKNVSQPSEPNKQLQRLSHTPKDVRLSTDKKQPELTQEDEESSFTKALNEIKIDQDLMRKMKSRTGAVKLIDVNFVYILDSGGQPPFRELLPHLVQQSSGIVLFQKLNERLDFKPTIKYREEGVEEEGYECQLTNEQILHQYFQAVQALNSTVFVIGTHRDLEDKCTESRAEKNRRLLEAFQPTLGGQIAFYKKENPFDELMFPVDSTSRESEEERTAESFRRAVTYHCIKKKGDEKKIPLPWFVLEQLLQLLAEKLNTNVLSIDECYEAAGKKVHIDCEKCRAALKYLGKLNIIFYRPDILPNVVFCNAQVILDKLTELARCSHRMQTNTKSKDLHIPQGMKSAKGSAFQNNAIIDAELLNEFPSHYRPCKFEPSDFLKLLKGLLIAGQLKNGEHFIPSLLPDLPSEEVSKYRVTSSDHLAPMTIHYSKSMIPVGVVPALIVHLQNVNGWSPFFDGVKPVCMKHNCMQFEMPGGKAGSLTLIDSTKFLEIHVKPKNKVSATVCSQIKDMLLSGLNEAHKSLHYDPPAAEVGLICSGVCGNQKTHLATLDEERETWRCYEDKTEGDNLNDKQNLWFEKGGEETSLSFTQTTTHSPSHQSGSLKTASETGSSQREEGKAKRDLVPAKTKSGSTSSPQTLSAAARPIIIEPLNLPELLRLGVPEAVGVNYKRFGIFLLNDTKGSRLASIEDECRGRPEEIMLKILQEWLKGKGLPVSWKTLIKTLRDTGLPTLAEEIRAAKN